MMSKFEVLIPEDMLAVLRERFSEDEIAIVINQAVRRQLEEWCAEHACAQKNCSNPPCPSKPTEGDDVNSQEWTI